MEAREIYHVLQSIIKPIHAHDDQIVAIAKWIEAEFEYKPRVICDHEFKLIKTEGVFNYHKCTKCGKIG